MKTEQKVEAIKRKLVRVKAERDAWFTGYEVTGDEVVLRTATAYGNVVRRLRAKLFSLSH